MTNAPIRTSQLEGDGKDHRRTRRALRLRDDRLRRLGIRIFGAVLNNVSAANPDESYYLQYYDAYTPTGTVQPSGWQQLREGLSKVTFFG